MKTRLSIEITNVSNALTLRWGQDEIIANREKVKIMTIEWNWPYETGTSETEIIAQDVEDTNDGKLLENYSFDIIVTGSQVEPVVS